jgi:hypothetical protein
VSVGIGASDAYDTVVALVTEPVNGAISFAIRGGGNYRDALHTEIWAHLQWSSLLAACSSRREKKRHCH